MKILGKGPNMSMEQQNYNNLSNYAGNALNDLNLLKHDYKTAGGSDPAYLSNVQNLENFYSKYQNNNNNNGPQSYAPPSDY